LKIRATNAIVLNDTGETTVSIGGSLEVYGLATGSVDIQTAGFNSLNNFIALSAFNTLDLLSLSSLTVTGQSSINISSSNITLNAPNITAATAVIGEPSAFGSVCAYFGNSSRAANGSEFAIIQENNGRTFLNAVAGTDLRFRINNTDVMIMSNDGLYMSQKLVMNDNPIRIRSDANHALAFGNSGTYNVGIDGAFLVGYRGGALGSSDPTFNDKSFAWSYSNLVAYKPLIMNCNAISNIGAMSRYMISTEIQQPVIQYAYVSTTGALSGTVTVTLPQRYTSVSSYNPFAVVVNDATTTFYVSTITRATFEIGWSGYTGFSDIIFSWNTMGT